MHWEAKIVSTDGTKKIASVWYSSLKKVFLKYSQLTLISIWRGRKLRRSNTASSTLANKRSPATRQTSTHFPDSSSTTTKITNISRRIYFPDSDWENLAIGEKSRKSTKKKERKFLSNSDVDKKNKKKRNKNLEQSGHYKKRSNKKNYQHNQNW